jgi:hypothetical protein
MMFSSYHEYGKNPMALSCRPSGIFGPYTMDRNNYIHRDPPNQSTSCKNFCIVNCKEDYDHLKLACKPIFQKIDTLHEKASIEVEGKHFELDILMGGDMKFLQLLLGLDIPQQFITYPKKKMKSINDYVFRLNTNKRMSTNTKVIFYGRFLHRSRREVIFLRIAY